MNFQEANFPEALNALNAINLATPKPITPTELIKQVVSSKLMYASELIKYYPEEKIADNDWVTIVSSNFSCFEGIQTRHGKLLITILKDDVTISDWDGISCDLPCDENGELQLEMTPIFKQFCKCISCQRILTYTESAVRIWLANLQRNGIAAFFDAVAKARINELQTEIKKIIKIDLTKTPQEVVNEIIRKISSVLQFMLNPRMVISSDLQGILATYKCLTDCSIDGRNFQTWNILNRSIPITVSTYLSAKNVFILYDKNRLWALPTETQTQSVILGLVKGKRAAEMCTWGDSRSATAYIVLDKDTGIIAENGKDEETKELSTDLSTPALGEFSFAGTTPTESELSAQIKVKNPNVDVTSIQIESITATTAKINGKSPKYKGSVDVTYSKSAFLSMMESMQKTNQDLMKKIMELENEIEKSKTKKTEEVQEVVEKPKIVKDKTKKTEEVQASN